MGIKAKAYIHSNKVLEFHYNNNENHFNSAVRREVGNERLYVLSSEFRSLNITSF